MHLASPFCDRRALLMAKFEALLAECDLVADHAAYGETLNDREDFSLFKDESFSKRPFKKNCKSASSESKRPPPILHGRVLS